MLKKTIILAMVVILAGCRLVFPNLPQRFPQFTEHRVVGPGSYRLPQWSADSRYLAFIDGSQDQIKVYDTQTARLWDVVDHVDITHFDWSPNGNLTYLKYRPDLSGLPFPSVADLHQVDLNGGNDTTIGTNLKNSGGFVWFNDNERVAIILGEPTQNSIYFLNVKTDTKEVLLDADDIGLEYLIGLALSNDEQTLLINGIHDNEGQSEHQIIIYNLETKSIIDTVTPSQIIGSGNVTYPVPAVSYATNFGWVGEQRWFLMKGYTPGGDCYNYSLFFFNSQDLQNSFCIPSMDGVFDYPTISPDLTRISYLTVEGPGLTYIVVADLPPDLANRVTVSVSR